jgi:hypothetical protein
VFIEGMALVLVLLGLMFWLSLGLDWAYFSLSKLELPKWFRAGLGILSLCLFSAALLIWVVLRLARGLRSKALALVLEQRFPELDDRLITAVEIADSTTGQETPLTASMLQQTVDQVSQVAQTLEVNDVFQKKPLRRALMGAVVLMASIVGLGFTNSKAMAGWLDAYVFLKDHYWDRQTELVVKAIAQPGDRIQDFKDDVGINTNGKPGEYKHPRGSDLTLLVEVPQGKIVPERVQLYYRLAEGRGSSRVYMSKLGDRQFKYSIVGLLDSVQFWVKGGDFTNYRPYHVTVVAPPRVDRMLLECDYPDYTGLNPVDREGHPLHHYKTVQGTQVSIPMETDMLMHVDVNKPLVGVRIQTDAFEVNLSTESSQLTTFSSDGSPQRNIPLPPAQFGARLSSDGKSFSIPFWLTEHAAARLDGLSSPVPIPLPDGSLLRIYLHDADGILSQEPARLTINAIRDQHPVVDTELRGISSSITRKAVIPVAVRISDDYGVAKAQFNFKVDGEETWRVRPLQNPPQNNPKKFPLDRSDPQKFERFEVLPLDLAIGQKLTLTVFAEDGDNLNGPHAARGKRYPFKIVSNEELLSILYGKELNLRQRFEQLIEEVQQTEKDLFLHRRRVQEAKQLRAGSPKPGQEQEYRRKLQEIDTAVAVCAERGLHQVRKNTNESIGIEESFRDILEELVNNSIHSQAVVGRIGDLIVKPLHEINTVDFPAVDASIALFKLANDQGHDPTPRIDQGLEEISKMLVRMRAVLKEMQDLVKFHELVKNLKSMIEGQEKLTEETKRERKRNILKKLKGVTD